MFSSLEKFDGYSKRKLTVSEVKQIAGRAGRYKSMYPEGEVTCMDGADMQLLRDAMVCQVCRGRVRVCVCVCVGLKTQAETKACITRARSRAWIAPTCSCYVRV